MGVNNPEGKPDITVADVVVEQRIAALQVQAKQNGFTLGETKGTQLPLGQLREEIRRQTSTELGAVADCQIATNELVNVGDQALFRMPRGFVFGTIESVGPRLVQGSMGGISLDSTLVITQDGRVLFGRELVESSFVTGEPSKPVK